MLVSAAYKIAYFILECTCTCLSLLHVYVCVLVLYSSVIKVTFVYSGMLSHREIKVQHLASLSLSLHTILQYGTWVLEAHSNSVSRFVALLVQSLRVQGDSRFSGLRLKVWGFDSSRLEVIR